MTYRHIVFLGLGLLWGSGIVFVVSWTVLGCFKNNTRILVERIWFRCLAVGIYIGLAVLLASALGSIVQDTLKGIR